MKTITDNYKSNYDKINKILLQEKIIQEEYAKLISEIQNNDEIIQTFINFYTDYLKENKNFLIKNEILKNFRQNNTNKRRKRFSDFKEGKRKNKL